jgi:hypothetical protein
VRKNGKAPRSELEKMDREEMMKELALKLTYEGVAPGNATIINTGTSSGGAVVEKATQANTTVVGAETPPVATRANQPKPEENMLAMLSYLLTAMNAQGAGGSTQLKEAPKSIGPEAILQGTGVDPLSLPYKPDDSVDVSKFTPGTARAPLPAKLKMPSYIGQYDGTQDPDDHVHAFQGAG